MLRTPLACALTMLALSSCGAKHDATPQASEPAAQMGKTFATAQASAESKVSNAAMSAETIADAAQNNHSTAKPDVFSPLQAASATMGQTPQGRQLVRTANLNAQVKDVGKAVLAIETAALAQDGFVVAQGVNTDIAGVVDVPLNVGTLQRIEQLQIHGSVTVRVPSAKTLAFLRVLGEQLDFLQARNFNAQDVQFDLLRQQLEAQRTQALQRELAALAQASTAARLADRSNAVQASSQAQAARDEALVSRKQLEDQIAFSTVTLTLGQPPVLRRTEVTDVQGAMAQARPSFANRAGKALTEGWLGVQDAVLGLLSMWPLWLLIAAGGWAWRKLGIGWLARFKNDRQSSNPQERTVK